ncbi:putative N-acetylneuraminate lyase (sialic acid lyase) [Lentisphaera araneosa HTCC2155]|uniref:Putative N-acetylneuraminate lyase (Sialic acid lyase) n=1 Tax=Lentisphaera araneosa HTCC2155 TaxID=313628 RepID=A6DPU5_9BACT|nr:dihydrodipicolinate synthase family protein [Lentisphaera araneosa]EDM26390.1 putative N-acetylneuraminate lyase (sialic acid lyase) [Lentisphaera araneosa HTCC2155]
MKLSGLISAPYTPMDKDGNICFDRIPAYAESLKHNGITGVFVNGTTGEGMDLSLDERKAAAKCWISHKLPDFKVIIHVGENSLLNACHLAKHANESGADAIGVMMPLESGKMTLEDSLQTESSPLNGMENKCRWRFPLSCALRLGILRLLNFLKRISCREPAVRKENNL